MIWRLLNLATCWTLSPISLALLPLHCFPNTKLVAKTLHMHSLTFFSWVQRVNGCSLNTTKILAYVFKHNNVNLFMINYCLHMIFSKTIFKLENFSFARLALNNSRQIKERARKLNFQVSDLSRFS